VSLVVEPAAVFSPVLLLPSQVTRQPRANTPERRLMLAVLIDGIDIARGAMNATPTCLLETERWLRARDSEWPFSFIALCGEFGLDPRATRQAIERQRGQHVSRVPRDRQREQQMIGLDSRARARAVELAAQQPP
jgi:hypothetical protein